MKKNRIMSMLLAGLLLAGSTFTEMAVISAEEQTEIVMTEDEKVTVEKLEAFGAITNEYADMSACVTRRQMAKIISKFMQWGNIGTAVGKMPFIDVSENDPDADNIVALYDAGIITGDDKYRFYPDNYLTYDEAIVFVVNAVGYKRFAVREGGYPTGYLRIAIKNNMLKGLSYSSGSDHITFSDVYRMLDAALDVAAVVPGGYSDDEAYYNVSSTESFMNVTYGIYEYKGLVTGNEFTRLSTAESNLTDEQIEIDGKLYDTPGYVYGTSIGRAVDYFVRKTDDGTTEVTFVEENEKLNNVEIIDSEDIIPAKTTSTRIYHYDENDKEVYSELVNSIDVIYNGKFYRGYGTIQSVLPIYGYIEALDNTGDGVADVLFVYDYKNIVVGSVDAYKETIKAKFADLNGNTDVFDLSVADDVAIVLMPEGKPININGIKVGDIATVMESKGSPKMLTVYISRDVVTGRIDEIADDEYKIGENYYKLSADYSGENVSIGTTASFLLDFNGKIVHFERNADSAMGMYAVLAGVDYEARSLGNEIQVKLFTQEGTFVTAFLKENVRIDNIPYDIDDDLNVILSVLTENTTSGGIYYVHNPRVVRYVMSGEKISRIDTGNTAESGNMVKLCAGDSFLTRKSATIIRALDGTSGSGTWKYVYYPAKSGYVFTTPEAGNLSDESGYSVGDSLYSDYFYRNTLVYGSSYTRPIESYVMYGTNGSEIQTANAILLVGASISASSSSALNIVTEFTNVSDEDGEIVKCMYTNTGSAKILAETVNIVKNGTTTSNVSSINIENYVKPGMAIVMSNDVKGKVREIKIYAEYDAQNQSVIKTFTSSTTNTSENTNNTLMGTITAIDIKNGILEINDAGTEYLFPSSGGKVYIYRSDRNKVEAGELSAVSLDDTVLIRATDYYDVKEIIVYK